MLIIRSNEEPNNKSKFICQGGALEQVDAFGSAGLTGDQGSTGTKFLHKYLVTTPIILFNTLGNVVKVGKESFHSFVCYLRFRLGNTWYWVALQGYGTASITPAGLRSTVGVWHRG